MRFSVELFNCIFHIYIHTIVHKIIEYIVILYCLLIRLGLHPLLNSPLDYHDREIESQINSFL